MRVSIVVPDSIVVVDGEAYRIDDVEALKGEDIRAVQWYDTYGEVEYVTNWNADAGRYERRPNERITDFAPYEEYVEAWKTAKEEAEREREEAQAEARREAERQQAEFQKRFLEQQPK